MDNTKNPLSTPYTAVDATGTPNGLFSGAAPGVSSSNSVAQQNALLQSSNFSQRAGLTPLATNPFVKTESVPGSSPVTSISSQAFLPSIAGIDFSFAALANNGNATLGGGGVPLDQQQLVHQSAGPPGMVHAGLAAGVGNLGHRGPTHISPTPAVPRRPVPPQSQSTNNLTCAVCGDTASGYHYNALSCEGCKGFFRRTVQRLNGNETSAMNQKFLECKYNGNCEIDIFMRRKCPACRLKKCRAVGMLEECLLTDVQCQSKRRRRMQAKIQRMTRPLPYSLRGMPSSSSSVYSMDTSTSYASTSAYSQSPSLAGGVADATPNMPQLGGGASSGMSALQAQLNRPVAPIQYTLTPDNAQLISQVSLAYDAYKLPGEHPANFNSEDPHAKVTLARAGTVHAEAFVEFSKRVPGFETLSCDDQITLLKGAGIEAMILRSAHFYQEHRQRYLAKLKRVDVQEDTIQLMIDVFKKVYMLKLDEVHFALMQTLILFSPARDGLQRSDVVDSIQTKVTAALKQYCVCSIMNTSSRRPASSEPAPSPTLVFCSLMELLTELRVLKVTYSELLKKNRRGDDLTPLLTEIWDLNPFKDNQVPIDAMQSSAEMYIDSLPKPITPSTNRSMHLPQLDMSGNPIPRSTSTGQSTITSSQSAASTAEIDINYSMISLSAPTAHPFQR